MLCIMYLYQTIQTKKELIKETREYELEYDRMKTRKLFLINPSIV